MAGHMTMGWSLLILVSMVSLYAHGSYVDRGPMQLVGFMNSQPHVCKVTINPLTPDTPSGSCGWRIQAYCITDYGQFSSMVTMSSSYECRSSSYKEVSWKWVFPCTHIRGRDTTCQGPLPDVTEGRMWNVVAYDELNLPKL